MKKKNHKILFANVVSIGDELLNSGKINTTAPVISKELSRLGFQSSIHTLGDEVDILVSFLRDSKASVIITCGGMGSTSDDNTLLAVSKALKQKLVYNKKHLNYLKVIQRERDKKVREQFFKQALYPEKFSLDKNDWGTAPFLYYLSKKKEKKLIILLPGVPSETLNLFNEKVIPLLLKNFNQNNLVIKDLKILGLSELVVEQKIQSSLEYDSKEIQIAFLPSEGELHLQLKGSDVGLLSSFRKKIKKLFSQQVVYFSNSPLSYELHLLLIRKKIKIGFVESLTGGLLTSEFIAYPNSSKYLDSSLVTYSNAAKNTLGKLKKEIIDQFGVVSFEAVKELARNHLKSRKLDFCLALSGVAGPRSVKENKVKKVGTVYLGVAYKVGKIEVDSSAKKELIRSFSKKFALKGDRTQMRKKVVKLALITMADFFCLE